MFDFVVSGGVSRQEERMASNALQECCNGFGGMKRCVVKDYDIAWCKLRDERFFHPLQKEISVAVSGEDNGSYQCALF